MGLLDNYLDADTIAAMKQLNEPTPEMKQQALRQSLLATGLGILANNGQGPTRGASFGHALGVGGLMGMNAYQQNIQQAQKDQAEGLQMATALSKLKKDAELQRMFLGSAPQSNAAGVSALAEGAQEGDIGPTVTNAARISQSAPVQNPVMSQIPREAIAADLYANGGKNLGTWMYDRAKPNMQVHNGYAVDMNRVQPGFLPGVSVSQNGQATVTGVDPKTGTPVVYAPPGALETYRAYQNAGESARANYDPQEITSPDGSKTLTTRGRVVGQINGTQPGFPRVSPQEQASRDGDRKRIIQQELEMNPTDPNLRKEAKSLGIPIQSEISQSGQKEFNTNWIKNTYQPVQDEGAAASNIKTQVQTLRQIPMDTGWGTEAKAGAASVLSGLGIAPKNAEMFASNAQRFQQVASERLWTVLNAAKGPQTEGDASRAQQTFAKLGNTPQANQFILDLAEAKANRDAMKSSFYQDGYGIAKQNGEYDRVDREWRKVMPSIWNDPIMQKWKVK